MTQYSTELLTKDDREDFFKLIKKQRDAHSTDLYVNCFTEQHNMHLKGKCIELNNVQLGQETRKSRIASLQQLLQQESATFEKDIKELKTEQENLEKEKIRLQAELEEKSEALSAFEMKELKKNRVAQANYTTILEQKEKLQNSLAEVNTALQYLPERIATRNQQYIRQQDVLNYALTREEKIFAIEEEEIKALETKRSEIKNKILKLQKEHKAATEEKDSRAIEMQMSAYQSQVLKLNSEIHRLQRYTRATKERYYLMKSWKEKEHDLVCFSRRFTAEAGNIESEMSHRPRAQVDPAAANKLLNIFVYALTILNFILIIAEIQGVEINFLTYHTLYILAIFGMFIYTNILMRRIDRIFLANYYCLYTKEIDIAYTAKDGEQKSMRLKCYSFELLLSDKMSVTDVFSSSEADIIAAIDQRNQDLVIKFEKIIAQMETADLAHRNEIQQLQTQNQVIAERYQRAYYNAKADILREERNIELEQPPNHWIPVVIHAISVIGLISAIIAIGYAIPDAMGAEFFNISLTSGKAFTFGLILGIILTIAVARWIGGGSFKFRRGASNK